jgi:indole-3-glycerol phosphate synthase
LSLSHDNANPLSGLNYKEVRMHPRLREILAHKKKEIEDLKRIGYPFLRKGGMSAIRDFKGAISVPGEIGLIAEIKFASPSEGGICEKMDPCAIGRIYEDSGAAAISLLTDRRFFGGDLDDLPRLKQAVSLPILRKDFILDEIQIKESLFFGADAVLLIARILEREQLKEFLAVCEEVGLASLTEIHDLQDLGKALECGAEIIGINNRNLETFEVDLRTTIALAPQVPEQCTLVSESGIFDQEDIRRLRGSGIRTVLVGTSIMKSSDMRSKIQDLVHAGQIGET